MDRRCKTCGTYTQLLLGFVSTCRFQSKLWSTPGWSLYIHWASFRQNRGARQQSGDILFLSDCCEFCFESPSYHENSLEVPQRTFLHRADSPAPDSLAIPLVQVGDALVVTCKPQPKQTRGRRKLHVLFRCLSGLGQSSSPDMRSCSVDSCSVDSCSVDSLTCPRPRP